MCKFKEMSTVTEANHSLVFLGPFPTVRGEKSTQRKKTAECEKWSRIRLLCTLFKNLVLELIRWNEARQTYWVAGNLSLFFTLVCFAEPPPPPWKQQCRYIAFTVFFFPLYVRFYWARFSFLLSVLCSVCKSQKREYVLHYLKTLPPVLSGRGSPCDKMSGVTSFPGNLSLFPNLILCNNLSMGSKGKRIPSLNWKYTNCSMYEYKNRCKFILVYRLRADHR